MDSGITLEHWNSPGRRVLLVDDEPQVQFVIKFLIKEWQFEVLTASSGSEALNLFKTTGNIDLIVTDYLMPDMNGWEFARQIRQINPTQRILMLTALPEMLQGNWDGKNLENSGEDMPVDRILPKPPHPISQLRTVMEELLQIPVPGHS